MERGPFWRAGLLPESPWEAHPVTIIANLGEPIGESRFKRDAPFVEKVPDRRRAGRDPTLGRKPFGDLMKRDVRRLSDKVKNERFMRIKLRAPWLALLARRDLTVVAITAIPFPAVEIPTPKRLAALRVERPSKIDLSTRHRRSVLKPWDMSTSLKINNETESHLSLQNPERLSVP